MRHWDTLADEAQLLISQSNHLPLDQMLLEQLDTLLRLPLPDALKEIQLRRLLAIRWTVIAQTSLDYTFNPQLRLNRFYLEIAEKITPDDAAVCQTLMPTVKKIIGTGFSPEDVVTASEDVDGQFILSHFLTHTRGDALIALLDTFEFTKENTDRLFPTEVRHTELFDLTAADRERICLVAGEASQNYFQALEKIHRVMHGQKPSVGLALKELTIALLKSSKIDAGAELTANISECKNPISKFYKMWLGLSDEIKNKIKNYRADGATQSLESYLLCLLVHAKEQNDEIVISEAEFQRVLSEKILPCTHQMGEQFDALLKHHPDLFGIPLPGMELFFETEVLPDEVTLRALSENFQRAVRTHSPVLDVNDDHIAAFQSMVEILARSTLHETVSNDDLKALVALINDHEELTRALQLLPSNFWESLFRMLESEGDVAHIFLSEEEGKKDSVKAFKYLLAHLPTHQWKILFDALYETGLEGVCDPFTLAVLFGDEIPEIQWSFLREAVNRLVDVLFVDIDDIVSFLYGLSLGVVEKIIPLFQESVDRILQDPRKIGYLFFSVKEELWGELHGLFRLAIQKALGAPSNYDLILDQFDCPEEKELFLQEMCSDVDFLCVNPSIFVRLLKKQSSVDWFALFNSFGNKRVEKFIYSEESLAYFLNQFEKKEDRVACVHAMQNYLKTIRVTPVLFCRLVTSFPECETSLLMVFKPQLKNILSEYLSTLPVPSNIKPCVANDIRKDFIFLAEKILPVILLSRNVNEHCEGFVRSGRQAPRQSFSDVDILLSQQFSEIEEAMRNKHLNQTDGCIRKLQLLDQFMKVVDVTKNTKSNLKRELIAYFGKDFFARMLYFTHHFVTVRGIGIFPERTTKVKKPGMVDALRSRVSTPIVPMRPSTAPEVHPSFGVTGVRLFRQPNIEKMRGDSVSQRQVRMHN